MQLKEATLFLRSGVWKPFSGERGWGNNLFPGKITSMIPSFEHNLVHNSSFFRVTLRNKILNFCNIMRQPLGGRQLIVSDIVNREA